jgi:hypothetical protein
MGTLEIPVNLILSLISNTNAQDGVWQYADKIPTVFLVDLADYGTIDDDDIEEYVSELSDRGYEEAEIIEAIQSIRKALGKESS